MHLFQKKCSGSEAFIESFPFLLLEIVSFAAHFLIWPRQKTDSIKVKLLRVFYLTTPSKFSRNWKEPHKTVVISSASGSVTYRKHSDQVTKAPIITSCQNLRGKQSFLLRHVIQSYPASFFLTGIQSRLVLQSIGIPKHSEGNGGRKFASPRKTEGLLLPDFGT